MSSHTHLTDTSRTRTFSPGALSALVLAVLLLLSALTAVGPQRAAAERLNGAGVVVQFDDGSILYAYVQFAEDEISSEELLYRSGLDIVVSPYGGLGVGVCSINGSGCPSDNCFCASYTNPAYFWHFYARNSGSWMVQPFGPTTRTVSDGDIDGWSWNAGNHALPETDIDSIALLNGIDRNAPEPTPTATLAPPTETPTPTPTPTPTATPTLPPAPTNTPPAAPTATPTGTATSPAATTPMTTSTAASTSTRGGIATDATATGTTPSPTASPPATASPAASPERSSPTPSASETAEAPGAGAGAGAAPSPPATLAARATTVAVMVDPSGTVTPVPVREVEEAFAWQPLLLFGGVVVAIGAVGGLAWFRRQQHPGADEYDAA